jgi:hypothetical protein
VGRPVTLVHQVPLQKLEARGDLADRVTYAGEEFDGGPGSNWSPWVSRDSMSMYLGDPETGERLLDPLRKFGRPLLDLVSLRSYAGLQSLIDPTVPHGRHYYWKSTELGPLDDDAMVEQSLDIRSPPIVLGRLSAWRRGRRCR